MLAGPDPPRQGRPAGERRPAVHHVIWWESPEQGPTDLDNLLPLCSKHHHAVHDHGWQLILAPDRTLTIRLPDGQVMTSGPPGRNTA